MNWSAEQQRLLQALGHDLLVHGTQWPTRAAPVVPAFVGAASAAMGPGRGIAAGSQQTTVWSAAPTVSVSSRAHEKLLEALRRAAGGNDIAGLVDDIEKLRNQAALKRALWPRLRALRRSH